MNFEFLPYDEADRDRWDRFVSSNPHAWPGQDSAIIDFEVSRGNRSLSHLVLDAAGHLAAVVPMFLLEERRARFLSFRVLASGTALRAGPLLRAEYSPGVRRQFWQAWHNWLMGQCRVQKIDSIRVGLPLVLGQRLSHDFYGSFPLREQGFEERFGLSLLVDLHAVPGDIAQSYEPKCRNMVRRARGSGVEVKEITQRGEWMNVYDLNLQTFEGAGVKSYSRSSMQVIWDRFVARGLSRVFAAAYKGEPVAVAVTVGTAFSQYYWMGFRRRPCPVPGSANLVVSHMLEKLRESGTRYCEMGGVDLGSKRLRGISRFKEGFGGTPYYGMQGIFIVSQVKQAAADLVVAIAEKARKMLRRGHDDPGGEMNGRIGSEVKTPCGGD